MPHSIRHRSSLTPSRLLQRAVERMETLGTRSLESGQVIRLERKVLALSQAVFGSESRVATGAKALLAETLDRDGQTSEALVLRTEGHDATIRDHGEAHADSLVSELRLAGMLAAAKRNRQAKRHLRHIVVETRLRPDVDVEITLGAMYQLGRLYLEEGKPKKAQAMLEPALVGYRAKHGDAHEDTWRAASSLAIALGRQGEFDAAISILRHLLTLQGGVLDGDDTDLVATRWQLAEWLHQQGAQAEAETLATSVLASKVRRYGYGHEESTAVRALLAGIFTSSTKR
jgi:tetratricopeptide (TPR) repeat protein